MSLHGKYIKNDLVTLESAPRLHSEQQFGLDLAAMYSVNPGKIPVNTLSLGDSVSPGLAAETLKSMWGVDDEESARSAIQNLLEGGHRRSYEAAVAYLTAVKGSTFRMAGSGVEGHAQALSERAGVGPLTLTQYFVAWELCGVRRILKEEPSSILAWDLGRAIHVSRMAFTAGYLSEEETWGWIARVTPLARQSFGSWKEYGDNFLVGRAYWEAISRGGSSSAESNTKADFDNSFGRSVLALLDHDESPWVRHPWPTRQASYSAGSPSTQIKGPTDSIANPKGAIWIILGGMLSLSVVYVLILGEIAQEVRVKGLIGLIMIPFVYLGPVGTTIVFVILIGLCVWGLVSSVVHKVKARSPKNQLWRTR